MNEERAVDCQFEEVKFKIGSEHIGRRARMPSWSDHEYIEVLAIHEYRIWGLDERNRYANYDNNDHWIVEE